MSTVLVAASPAKKSGMVICSICINLPAAKTKGGRSRPFDQNLICTPSKAVC
jgi:hypothetical protein